MQIITRNVIIIVLLLANCVAKAQYINPDSGIVVSDHYGDELNANWSPDGAMLLFNLIVDEENQLCIYDFERDTVVIISVNRVNFRNPVWHPDGDKIVFDSSHEGHDFLYVINVNSGAITNLLNRDIRCREASFSNSSRQVYFTGFDEIGNSWEIYSYDFIYDNLNKITDSKFGTTDPVISHNGKHIIASKTDPFNGSVSLELLNWYGEKEGGVRSFEGENVAWDKAGLKFYFVKKESDSLRELYSIWKDGTHIEKLTESNFDIATPAISPDGNRAAVSIRNDLGWDIIVVSLDDY